MIFPSSSQRSVTYEVGLRILPTRQTDSDHLLSLEISNFVDSLIWRELFVLSSACIDDGLVRFGEQQVEAQSQHLEELLVIEGSAGNETARLVGNVGLVVDGLLQDQLGQQHLHVVVVGSGAHHSDADHLWTVEPQVGHIAVEIKHLVLEPVVGGFGALHLEVHVDPAQSVQQFVSQKVGCQSVEGLLAGFVELECPLHEVVGDGEVMFGHVFQSPKFQFELRIIFHYRIL